jgi:uncharacterized protein
MTGESWRARNAGAPAGPRVEPSAAFWSAANERALVVQRCEACGTYIFRPRRACTFCLSPDVRWVRSSGIGELHSFSTVHRSSGPCDQYVVAIVQLEEGWHMLTNIVGSGGDELRIGMQVRVTFEEKDGRLRPVFVVDTKSVNDD